MEGHERMPAIVWMCGGAFRVVDRSVWIPELLHFARGGYVVASVEYRTGNEAAFPYPLMDVKAAIRYLKADENTPLFLILHGAKDARVPMKKSEVFYEKLVEKGVKAEFWILEEAAHGDDLFYQDEVLDRVIGFLRKTEKPDEVIS